MRVLDKDNPIFEAYRTVRTNIEFSNLDNNLKVIMVTSSQQGEGKSIFISNLAVCFSHVKDKKILLVDCNLRNPSIHKIFEISNTYGLTDILTKNQEIELCTNHLCGLDIITSGDIQENPSEILTSKKMKYFIECVREEYDYIFLDTPANYILTDAEILSVFSDGVIFIVSNGDVDREVAKLSIKKLKKLNANILGTVINKVTDKKNNHYRYY